MLREFSSLMHGEVLVGLADQVPEQVDSEDGKNGGEAEGERVKQADQVALQRGEQVDNLMRVRGESGSQSWR